MDPLRNYGRLACSRDHGAQSLDKRGNLAHCRLGLGSNSGDNQRLRREHSLCLLLFRRSHRVDRDMYQCFGQLEAEERVVRIHCVGARRLAPNLKICNLEHALSSSVLRSAP
jgi:hypothetical protein